MGGGGNGDSRRNEQMDTSDLVFILNPNRRPFLTPKFGVSDCMISSAFYQAHPQPQAYHPNSAQEYQQFSPRGFQLNSPQEYQLNPPQECQLNSPHGYQLKDESISSLEFPSLTTAQATMSPGYSSSPFPRKDDSCGVHLSSPSSSSPQKDDRCGESPQKEDSGGESPQKDDSGGDKHVPLAARRLMNHNKPGDKELLPRRQKRRIE